MPVIADQAKTTQIPRPPAPPAREPVGGQFGRPGAQLRDAAGRIVTAACAVSFVSGWATSVVATDLVAGWWRSDKLFCIAIAFLAIVFATATVSGVILLLQRQPNGRRLILVGAVVALLTYGGVFIAGARVAWIVYLLPLLPLAGVVLALRPETKRFVGDL